MGVGIVEYNLVYCDLILCAVVADCHHHHHTRTHATIVPNCYYSLHGSLVTLLALGVGIGFGHLELLKQTLAAIVRSSIAS